MHKTYYCPFQIYVGECWSGPEAGETYNRAGSSDKCVTKGFKKCDPNDKQECVGDKKINFVYGIDVTGTRKLKLRKPVPCTCIEAGPAYLQ